MDISPIRLYRSAFVAMCIVGASGSPRVHAGPSTAEALDGCDRTRDAAHTWTMRVTVLSTWRNSTQPNVHGPVTIFVANYVRDGNRFDIESVTPKNGQAGPRGAINDIAGVHRRAIVNGYFIITYGPSAGGAVSTPLYAADGGKYVTTALESTMSFADALEGRLADPEPLTEILRHSADTRISDAGSLIEGQPCLGVTGQSRYGTCTLYCDPKMGYLPRKIVVVKTGGDRYASRRVADTRFVAPSGRAMAPSKVTFTAGSMEFRRFGNVVLPVACHVSQRYDFSDGSWHIREMAVTREDVDLRPDLQNRPGLFEPDIPEGTPLANQDNLQLPYEWHGGKPVPRVNQAALQHMDATGDDFRARRRAEGMDR